MGNNKTKTLGVFALTMINVAYVLSLRNNPSMAVYGWLCIGWYVIGTVAFLIPLTLAGAELATGWPQGGGLSGFEKHLASGKALLQFSVAVKQSSLVPNSAGLHRFYFRI
jgi:hypothetical protein